MSRRRVGEVNRRGGGKGKLLKAVLEDLKDDIMISALTLKCFQPDSKGCIEDIGKNGEFMKKYFTFKKGNKVDKIAKLVAKWDQAIVKNSNVNSKFKIKNFLELRKLPSYKTITKARERWYNERLAEEPSTTRSGRKYGVKRFSLEDDFKLQLKF